MKLGGDLPARRPSDIGAQDARLSFGPRPGSCAGDSHGVVSGNRFQFFFFCAPRSDGFLRFLSLADRHGTDIPRRSVVDQVRQDLDMFCDFDLSGAVQIEIDDRVAGAA